MDMEPEETLYQNPHMILDRIYDIDQNIGKLMAEKNALLEAYRNLMEQYAMHYEKVMSRPIPDEPSEAEYALKKATGKGW
jgi:hypothetical protein